MSDLPLSVVVPTFERAASVERAVRALGTQLLPRSSYEVVVVVDGSHDDTVERLEAMRASCSLRVLVEPHRGLAASRNAGIRAACGTLVVLLDDDMEPSPACLEAHLRAHQGRPRRGVIGAAPIELAPEAPAAAGYIARKFERHLEHLARAGGPTRLRDIYCGNFSIEREILLELGGFDESFELYGHEDLELGGRLLGAGVELVYCAAALARQHYEKDLAALARDHFDKGRTAVQLARMHPEMASSLRLGSHGTVTRRWRLARAAALALSPRGAPTRAAVEAARRLERLGTRNADKFYFLVLDYFFWLGARAAGWRPLPARPAATSPRP